MLNGTLEHVAKHSLLYSFMLSQPFAVYVDAYPALENKLLLEADDLQYGEHGETVRILQHKLNKLSYYNDGIDGEFDILTEHALKKFQKDFQITITGQADPQTVYAIIQAEKKKLLKKVENLSESIYPGMHSNDVKTVQEALQYFGYYTGEIDGIYGPLTDKALKVAEDEHNIELRNEITSTSLITLYNSDEDEKVAEKVTEQVTSKLETKQNEVKKVEVKGANSSGVIQVARSMIGTPYVWGGESPGGFDCSGFIQYVFQTQSVSVPRTVSDIWSFGQSVDTLSIGDLVFFQTYKQGPSHLGIYLGDGTFIHAGASRGVEISEMSNSYWQQRYLGAKRIN